MLTQAAIQELCLNKIVEIWQNLDLNQELLNHKNAQN